MVPGNVPRHPVQHHPVHQRFAKDSSFTIRSDTKCSEPPESATSKTEKDTPDHEKPVQQFQADVVAPTGCNGGVLASYRGRTKEKMTIAEFAHEN